MKSFDSEKEPKDLLFQKYKNELMNFDKVKKNYLVSLKKFNVSEEKKLQIFNQGTSLDTINKSKNNKTLLSSHNYNHNRNHNHSNKMNHKKIKLNRLINKNKIKKPKFNSQLSSLKYYLLYSEPGVGKKSLQSIYEDLDQIQKNIDNFEENEKNKMNDYEKSQKNDENLNENKMVINIPDYASNKVKGANIDNFLGLCGTYQKYNYEFSKIKNLFGTKINLFEKRNIIKDYMKNMKLSNKTTSNSSCPKNKFKTLFPNINNQSMNKYKKINNNKSIKNISKNSFKLVFNN